ncbi:hypothetical protein Hanom_Chr10g00923321 [Helianthus anomalus]
MVVCDSSHTVPLCKMVASPFLITDWVLNQFGSSLMQFKRLRVCYLCRYHISFVSNFCVLF